MIRVLVVDDSVLIRRIVSRIFESDPSNQVVGTACNGLDALAKMEELRPDAVTLDVEMPELDVLQTLTRLGAKFSGVRVIMLSSHTERGKQVTIDALMNGASDYVTKPLSSSDSAYQQLGTELLGKVKQFFPGSVMPPGRLPARTFLPSAKPVPVVPRVAPSRSAVEVCAIGVSTGGPTALLEVMPMVPKNFPLPIVIVQHMPANFTQIMAQRLNGACSIEVVEGTDGMVLEAGKAIVAPGGFHMQVHYSGHDLVVKLDLGPKENSCRPAVDVLFRSLAQTVKGRVIAAILTGMGQDGLVGAQLLHDQGAAILAQDQATSTVWGMPGAIVGAGLADVVLPLGKIIPEILQRVHYR